MDFELRPSTEADRDWLRALDRTTMRRPGDDEAERRASFDRHFDPAVVRVIVAGGRDVGVLRVEERGPDLYVAVIEIAPEAQGRGLGTAVLRSVLARADAERRAVGLRVLAVNAGARRLYERLGFRVVADDGEKVEMRYEPR
jgi:ribosomal protein S18 acetylase RimI-like enzyme